VLYFISLWIKSLTATRNSFSNPKVAHSQAKTLTSQGNPPIPIKGKQRDLALRPAYPKFNMLRIDLIIERTFLQ